jgi:acetyl-CoA C-acetyltransferase
MTTPQAYIVAVARTAAGRRNGRLSGWHPADLAGQMINGLVARSGIDPAAIDDVVMGCVGQAGQQSFNVARNAVLSSVLPESVPGTSIDRQCGSSQQALHFAAQAVMSGTMDAVIAAGVESMSRVPMGLPATLPAQHGFGSYVSDEMTRRYPGVTFSQFSGAEHIARAYGLTREMLDDYAYRSHLRAIEATRSGAFDAEIVPVATRTLEQGDPGESHRVDEGIRFNVTREGFDTVRAIQPENGLLTAASASQISDGASGVMVVNERGLKSLGVEPLARIHHLSVMGHDPVIMLEAPIPATRRALQRAGLALEDIDLFEVNEAFASVPLAWLKALEADPERLNVHGGAIALGHPLGASGTRLMSTLISALQRRGGRYGLQTMCEGGGLANVTIIERL